MTEAVDSPRTPTPPRRPSVGITPLHASDPSGPDWRALDLAPVALVVLDAVGNVVDHNTAAGRLLGEAPTGLLRRGSPFMALVGSSARQFVVWRGQDDERPLSVALRAGGRLLNARLVRTELRDHPGWSMLAIHADDRSLEQWAHRLAFDLAETGVFIAETGGTIIAANDSLRSLVGIDGSPTDDLVGRRWQQVLLADETSGAIRRLHTELRRDGEWTGHVTATIDGLGLRTYEIVLRMRPFQPGRDSTTSESRALVGWVSDVTGDVAEETTLRDRATHDALTELLNREGFLHELERRFVEAQRSGNRLTLLYIDLDHFKSLNDHYGHRYGDVLLEAFAKRLRGSLKASDVVGRIGGDEFVVLFDPGLQPQVLDNVVNKLRTKLLHDYQLQDMTYTCTASFGSADYPWDASTSDELLEFADHAMYHAKSLGRNRFQRFDRAEFTGWIDRKELLESIEAGIARMEFVPWYQPQFDIETGRLVAAEALARWLPGDRPGEVLLPGTFLPLIESSPASVHLCVRMFSQVVVHMRSWSNTVGPIEVAVNLSAGQLRSEDVIAHLEELSGNYGPEVRRLRVEVVESSFYDGDPIVSENLDRLRALGITLSLDDFGTGHSSLLSLRSHDFTQVKIDRQFLVAADEGDADDRLVLETMISLSRGLGMQTVCEGVETQEQLDYLRSIGCEVAQGFLLGRPMPKEEFRTLLRTEDH